MTQDIRVRKILEALSSPENLIEILRGTLPAGLDDTVNLILSFEHSLSEV